MAGKQAVQQFSLPTDDISFSVHVALLTDNTVVISNWNDDTITLTTLEGHTLHVVPTDTTPYDVCQWTDDTFIATFPDYEYLVLYQKDHPLSTIRTISTEKGYHNICKYKDDYLICSTESDSYKEDGVTKYRGYIDIVSVIDGEVIRSTEVTGGEITDICMADSTRLVVLKVAWEGDSSPVISWYEVDELYRYKDETIFVGEGVKLPEQIAIHGEYVYLLGGREGEVWGTAIWRKSGNDIVDTYLTREQIDCQRITSIDISGSRLIITGVPKDNIKALCVRVYDL